jgi:hypothetical protein
VPLLKIRPVESNPTVDGFPLGHPYIEHVYAGVVGPTSVLVLRRADLLFRAFPNGIEIDPSEFAQSFGIGNSTGPNGMLFRTFDRLHRFRLATWDANYGTLDIPLEARPVRPAMLARLPESTQAVHRSLLSSLRPRTVDVGRRDPETATPPVPAPTVGLRLGA